MKLTDLSFYDNGGESFDRIAIVFNKTGEPDIFGSRWKTYEAIGSSHDGVGFFSHTHCQKRRGLGKKVSFEQLEIALQSRILAYLKSV